MIITLSSTNPFFSFLIGKNPSGIPIVRTLRSGSLIGWFPSVESNKYVVYFHDNPDTCSFQPIQGINEAKYVNVGQYSSPLIIGATISEILSNTIKKVHVRDTSEYEHTFYVSGLRIKNIKLFQCIRDTFKEMTFTLKHLIGFMHELTIFSKSTLFDLMNMISLLSVLIALGNKEAITLDDGAIEKYIRQINRATTGKVENDGWYLRYIFKKRAKLTKKYLPLLDTSRLSMTFGNTSDARADFVLNNIQDFNVDFVDIGCGVDLLIRRIIHKKWAKVGPESGHNYHLIDADRKVQEKHNNNGLICHASVDEFYEANPDFDGNVIMTEVIEHNEEEDAALIVHSVLSHSPRKLFITTPNYDFNKFFGSDGGFRHDDHHWEMTMNQYQTWLTDIVKEYPYDIVFKGVGDSIDGIPITSGAILTHR